MIACAALGALSGCGGAGAQTTATANGSGEAASAAAHFTHQQELIEQGGRLFVSDGCTGCHSLDRSSRFGPSFGHLAGSRVMLTDGRRVLVDERFLQAALTDPAVNAVAGYAPAPMIASVKRVKLSEHPDDVLALAAFIEQIGPENG
jgi:cytochrome c oxidase subunit 2